MADTQPPAINISQLSQRVAALEAGQEQILAQIKGLSQDVRAMGEAHKPQWATYAAWAGVVLVIVSMAGSGFIRDLDRHENYLETLNSKTIQHFTLGGHPRMDQRVSSIENRIEHLENEIFYNQQ